MQLTPGQTRYIAFLRGINVGGHHKVPMADLRKMMGSLGYKNITTILNSGNIIFDAQPDTTSSIEKTISARLENHFGFPIPTIVIIADAIFHLIKENPFEHVELTREIRRYISFLKGDAPPALELPWKSTDQSYTIMQKTDNYILSVLDLSFASTPKAMEMLEKHYGKDITTRNWNTIVRIAQKLGLTA